MADPPQHTAWPRLWSLLPTFTPQIIVDGRGGGNQHHIVLPACFATPVLPPPRTYDPQKYIPDCCNAIWAVLEEMAKTTPHGPKRRRLEQTTDVMEKVRVCGGVGGRWGGLRHDGPFAHRTSRATMGFTLTFLGWPGSC